MLTFGHEDVGYPENWEQAVSWWGVATMLAGIAVTAYGWDEDAGPPPSPPQPEARVEASYQHIEAEDTSDVRWPLGGLVLIVAGGAMTTRAGQIVEFPGKVRRFLKAKE